MLDFGALPPEINSGRMYAGPGSGPMMAAAAAWDELAAELATAASGYSSVMSELTSAPWVGPASRTKMVAAVVPYMTWLSATAGQDRADRRSRPVRAAAAFEVAFMMTVPPPVIAANRVLLATLIATNFFGQNTPAIMATEAQYMEMWAQDAGAMYGYAAASAIDTQVGRRITTSPPKPPTRTELADQALVVTQATAEPAGNSGQAAMSTTQMAPQHGARNCCSKPRHRRQTNPVPSTAGQPTVVDGLVQRFLPRPTRSGSTPAFFNTMWQTLQAYFGVGLGNFGWSLVSS